jgi:ribosomal protein S8
MSQDIISDALNQVMNAKRARKSSVMIRRHSKLLIEVLELAKKKKYIESFKVNGEDLEIKFNLNECKAIKPRFDVRVNEIDKYVKRFLPSRDFGMIVISTSKGLMTNTEAVEKNIGGSLIAYFY